MKLSKHEKRIVDAIIKGTVYDIPSYLKEFNKCSLKKYNFDHPREKFLMKENGKEYKVFVDYEKSHIKSTATFNSWLGPFNVDIPIPKKKEDIPDDAWEYRKAELVNDIKPVKIEYNDEIFEFDFTKEGVNVANNFEDIIEFMNLWTYLKHESLILEVPKDISADDLGILFELKQKEINEPQPYVIQKKNIAHASVHPVVQELISTQEFHDFAPQYKMSEFMDESWELNKEHQKNCEEYIGKKILPTGKLRIYAKQLYTTKEEWHFRIPLIISIVALMISIIPVIQSFSSTFNEKPIPTTYRFEVKTILESETLNNLTSEIHKLNEFLEKNK